MTPAAEGIAAEPIAAATSTSVTAAPARTVSRRAPSRRWKRSRMSGTVPAPPSCRIVGDPKGEPLTTLHQRGAPAPPAGGADTGHQAQPALRVKLNANSSAGCEKLSAVACVDSTGVDAA